MLLEHLNRHDHQQQLSLMCVIICNQAQDASSSMLEDRMLMLAGPVLCLKRCSQAGRSLPSRAERSCLAAVTFIVSPSSSQQQEDGDHIAGFDDIPADWRFLSRCNTLHFTAAASCMKCDVSVIAHTHGHETRNHWPAHRIFGPAHSHKFIFQDRPCVWPLSLTMTNSLADMRLAPKEI